MAERAHTGLVFFGFYDAWNLGLKILSKIKTKGDEVVKALTCVFIVAAGSGESQL